MDGEGSTTMSELKETRGNADEANGSNGNGEPEIKVTDRRHWAQEEDEGADDDDGAGASPYPTMIDEFRQRAESAEKQLHEYIVAFKSAQEEQDKFRERLTRDVERRVQMQFGDVVGELLHSIDDLDLALSHVKEVAEAEPLAKGVAIARDRFLAVLQRHGVEPIEPDGEEFDPNLAEAMQVEPVDSEELNGRVTRTLQIGYRLGERVIRPARVAVGKLQS
jgi:molecular chaperone GrpE (heat shock protein)